MRYFGFNEPSFNVKRLGFAFSRFTPADLFANGEQGVWFDPSDLSTMFQDVNGTKPVTKDGDPVGLILDKSHGMDLGENLTPVINFNNASRWVKGYPSNEISEDGKTVTTTTTAGGITLTGLNNGWYKLSMEANVSGANFQVRDGNDGKVFFGISGNSLYNSIVYISNNELAFRTSYGQSSLTIHDMQLQKLKGNHAIQATASARPIYRTDGNLHWLEDDAVDDTLYIPNSKSSFKFLHDGSGSAICVAAAMMGEYAYRQVIATHNSATENAGVSITFADRFNVSTEGKSLWYQVLRGVGGTNAGVASMNNAYTVGERFVFTGKAEGSTSTLFKNKMLLAQHTGLEPSTSPSTYDVTLFGPTKSGSARLKIYGLIICNTTELQLAENYLATKAGVTL